MIVLDTHIWVWWIDENPKLTADYRDFIEQNQTDGLGVSVFSFWEVAKLFEKQRLEFSVSLKDWFSKAASRPNIKVLPLTAQIIVESVQLPDGFHKDPADQIIVATARVYDCPLVTYDAKILNYKHVELLP